ncbi:hypothetical protein GCK72_000524 [Caenorhabditis remanei]|uniref:Uncharacterized protein n=1 Tax=Caenorhabditis remanei TaxID=31234 RepID=A0A6A5HND3_CAERE|nr:hypothetical protein GCK72_000524 [Caenorhabditis remanei]KAF1768711.1 hypothetical protein GCK72_000524 [Caenorhabditis remanei]
MSGAVIDHAEENQRLRRQIESLHLELHAQRELFRSIFGMENADLQLENQNLKGQLQQAFEDKRRFNELVEEMEEEKQKMILDHSEEMKKAQERIKFFKEEVQELQETIDDLDGDMERVMRLEAVWKSEEQDLKESREAVKVLEKNVRGARAWIEQQRRDGAADATDDTSDTDASDSSVSSEDASQRHRRHLR